MTKIKRNRQKIFQVQLRFVGINLNRTLKSRTWTGARHAPVQRADWLNWDAPSVKVKQLEESERAQPGSTL